MHREKKKPQQREEQRRDIRDTKYVFYGVTKRVTKSIIHAVRIMRIQSQIQSLFFLVFTCWEEVTVVFPPPHLSC